jgi:ABC-type nitrate/sulfonate/bicarbonate transport system substrate-binding protein
LCRARADRYASGRDATEGVLAAEANFGAATEFPFAADVPGSKDTKIIASVHRFSDISVWVGRRDLGVELGADLAGKRIGLCIKGSLRSAVRDPLGMSSPLYE